MTAPENEAGRRSPGDAGRGERVSETCGVAGPIRGRTRTVGGILSDASHRPGIRSFFAADYRCDGEGM